MDARPKFIDDRLPGRRASPTRHDRIFLNNTFVADGGRDHEIAATTNAGGNTCPGNCSG
jgi:hypothetical protein